MGIGERTVRVQRQRSVRHAADQSRCQGLVVGVAVVGQDASRADIEGAALVEVTVGVIIGDGENRGDDDRDGGGI